MNRFVVSHAGGKDVMSSGPFATIDEVGQYVNEWLRERGLADNPSGIFSGELKVGEHTLLLVDDNELEETLTRIIEESCEEESEEGEVYDDGLDEEDEDEEDEEICSACNGSGEGRHDGSTCYACGGSGVEGSGLSEDSFTPPDDPDPDEEPHDSRTQAIWDRGIDALR